MAYVVAILTDALSSALMAPDQVRLRFLNFFTANIRNSNKRKAYARAAGDFLRWREQTGVAGLRTVHPTHVAAWIEELSQIPSVPIVKLRRADIRHVFDWMETG